MGILYPRHNSWVYLTEVQGHKLGTILKILKNNAPKYVKEQIKELIRQGKIKNIEELAKKAIEERKPLLKVLEEYGVKLKDRKYGKGSRRCIICGNHDRIIRRYNLEICGRCFREWADVLGFKVLGE